MNDTQKTKSQLIQELVQLRQEVAQLRADRNVVEQKVVQQQELLSTVIDAIPLGVFVKTVQDDYRFAIWNTQMELFFETDRDNVLGNSDYDLFDKEKADYFRSTDVAVMDGRKLVDIPVEEVPTSEGVILAHTTKVPIYDNDGHPKYLLGILEDITERKQTEDQLRRLLAAVEQSANTIVITDLEGYIEYANPSFERTTGYTLKEAQGQRTSLLKSGHTSSEEYQTLWQTITAGEIWHGEFYNKKKNGEHYWESASISPIQNEQGEITHFLAVKEDITERKRAEEALRKAAQENSRLVAAINSAAIGVTISDATKPDHPLIFVNPAFTGMTGYAAEEVLNKNCRFLQGPDTDPEAVAKIRQAIAEERSIIVELLNYRKDGTPFWNELSINPIFDEQGNLTNFVGVQANVTTRKETEVERERLLVEIEETYRQYIRGEWAKFLGNYDQDRLQVEHRQVEVEPTQSSKQILADTQNQVAREGKARVLSTANQNGHSIDAAMVAPIALRGETIGTLSLQDIDPNRRWTAEEIALVETVSEQLALTVENLRLFDNTQRRATREQLTRQIVDKMRQSPDLETIIQTGTAELAKALDVPRVYVKLISEMEATNLNDLVDDDRSDAVS